MTLLRVLLIVPFMLSCKTSEQAVDSALYGTALSGAVSYLTYSEVKELYQGSAIALQLPDNFYAEEITSDEFSALRREITFEPTFPSVMAYMGTRSGYDYYLFKSSFASRRIVKVKSTAHATEDVDTLSVDSKKWKYISPRFLERNFNVPPIQKGNRFFDKEWMLLRPLPQRIDENAGSSSDEQSVEPAAKPK